MTRIELLAALAFVATGLSACAGPAHNTSVVFVDEARQAGQPTVLVVAPHAEATAELWRAFRDEVRPSLNVITLTINQSSQAKTLDDVMRDYAPVCVLLVDNLAARLYRNYQALHPGAYAFPPAVVVMASFAEQVVATLKNATGISYEVPAITAFTSLLASIERSVRRIGVVFRPQFRRVFQQNALLVEKEGMVLVPAEVSSNATPKATRKALLRLLHEGSVDALWVMNDNVLLKPRQLDGAWFDVLEKHPVPVVVGVASLVSTRRHFGAFAIVPDHAGLGVQAGNLLLDLQAEEFELNGRLVELPISVKTIVDLPLVKEYFGLKPGALERIDLVLQ